MKYTMRERCLIDTSVLLKVILEGEVGILNKLQDYILCIPVNVLEETSFKIITSSILEKSGEKFKFHDVKRAFERGVAGDLIRRRMHLLNEIKRKMQVLELNEEIFDDSKEIIEKYNLLPNDALIAAICKHHGIRKIATFDEDFKRVDFLDVIEIEEG